MLGRAGEGVGHRWCPLVVLVVGCPPVTPLIHKKYRNIRWTDLGWSRPGRLTRRARQRCPPLAQGMTARVGPPEGWGKGTRARRPPLERDAATGGVPAPRMTPADAVTGQPPDGRATGKEGWGLASPPRPQTVRLARH